MNKDLLKYIAGFIIVGVILVTVVAAISKPQINKTVILQIQQLVKNNR